MFTAVASLLPVLSPIQAQNYIGLGYPNVGDHSLQILSPTLLELYRVNTQSSAAAQVDSWNWVNSAGELVLPSNAAVKAVVNGQTNTITAMGFKRRPIHAQYWSWDVRVGNYLYLQLGNPIGDGQTVHVINDGSLWPTNMQFTAIASPLRYSPAIHVNHEGYLPGFSKKAIVGYYLGSMGEMNVPGTFSLINADTGDTVYAGTLSARQDFGYLYQPAPYQQAREADFSSFNTPGNYRLTVPGLGASAPFRIDEGVAMNFARTYALGLLHQRSGFNVAMPYTRFTHEADHLAPASIPTNAAAPFEFTWATIADYASYQNPDNPLQSAPVLSNPSAQRYPFVNKSPVDVSGGHFEAANYSKVAWNSALIIHVLVFAADSFPGVANMDNLGIPESGDGISDALQEAKWEADCLVKMQDLDGGFYYMIHPLHREYEDDVLPEDGDPQVAWPKNTASTAAAVAALVQCASSPAFKAAYPQAATNYMAKAMLGWKFLTNAINTHGFAGAYQRIMHFDDSFTHTDDLAWAACELFLATGDTQFRTLLETWLPDPTHPDTKRWGWWGMYANYGNAIRSYVGAVRSGRLQSAQLNQGYLTKCIEAISDSADDVLLWSAVNAYGTSFPTATKAAQSAGWYYSSAQAFDMVVAQEFAPDPSYVDAIIRNMNYEAGCNPVNVSFVTGLGWKRQLDVVDQYSANDRRVLPKIGVPIGNIQAGFGWHWLYQGHLSALCYPSEGALYAPYPFYDRWADFWDPSTEASTTDTVRCFATTLWLAAQTAAANRPWTFTNAQIVLPSGTPMPGQPLTVTLQVSEPNLTGAKIVWEATDHQPAFGSLNHTFTPVSEGPHWIEAEVHWPDGRRAFAMSAVNVQQTNVPQLGAPARLPTGEFALVLAGAPHANYITQASTNLVDWVAVSTNQLPGSAWMLITDPDATHYGRRYYRAVSQ